MTLIQTTVRAEPRHPFPLEHLFADWQRAGSSSACPLLAERERVLGPATLRAATLRLLFDLAAQLVDDLHCRIHWHEATLSAAQTQRVLPPGVLVQKTVTVTIGGRLVLWSSVGDHEQSLAQRRLLAERLGLPRRAAKSCSTNPTDCSPVQEYGMLPGMVSTFLPPHHPCRLEAVVFAPACLARLAESHLVAVSLSPFESLLLPLEGFVGILRGYARLAYAPSIRWIELPQQDEACCEHPPDLVSAGPGARQAAGSHSERRYELCRVF